MSQNLSEVAWNKILSTYNKIIKHPFIQEMALGVLSKDKFAYYMEQDSFYLKYYAQCNAIITQEIPYKYKLDFLKYTKDTMVYTQYVEQYFLSYPEYKSNSTTRATEGYTDHLIKNCAIESVEVSVAAILACEWIYKELGSYLYNNSVTNNPYESWISPLVDQEYVKDVNNLIDIFDELGANTSSHIQNMMLDAFYKSSNWEFYFWDDS